jgi:hypothetical protein
VRIGKLEAVRRYPVKSLRGEILDRVHVDVGGIPGDRSSAFFVRGGNVRAGKTYRGKENDVLHLIADAQKARDAASERGVDIDLRRGEHFFDDAAISLVVDRWLDDVSRYIGYRVEWERFRPNFFVLAADGFAQSESDLVDAELQLGAVRLRVRSPIERCVTITYDPRGNASDPRILRYLAQERDATMGIYCDVVVPGPVKAGDIVTLRQAQGDT